MYLWRAIDGDFLVKEKQEQKDKLVLELEFVSK